jgi:uncharacterized protein (TIGR02001 family)
MGVSRDTVGPSVPLRFGVLYLSIAAAALAPESVRAISLEGDLTYTSDYVLRGLSQTAGGSAGQIDVHAVTGDGTFLGIFASTLGRVWQRHYQRLGWDYELEEYLGHRFDVSPSWSTTLTVVNYSYLNGNARMSNDYQELSVAFSYLDLWTVTLASIPNAVRYDRGYRLGRYLAYAADVSAQLPVTGRLFFTAGTGYYTSDNTGYAYGNAGFAFKFKSLRLDAGYYVAQEHARTLFPYGRAGSRFAGSVSWHF